MKKTILVAIATICSLTAIGQPSRIVPQYLEECLFPKYLTNECYSLNSNFLNSNFHAHISKVAQPYFIDSTISIKGIAAMTTGLYDEQNPLFIQIRNATLDTVLAEIRYDTIESHFICEDYLAYSNRMYIEQLFDNSITIDDSLFYITVDLGGNKVVDAVSTLQLDSCNNGEMPLLVQGKDDNGWMLLKDFMIDNYSADSEDLLYSPCEMLAFPILGTLNTSSLGDDITLREDVLVYPNPADKTITVDGKRIEKIIIYDMLALERKVVITNKEKTIINIDDLNKGVYSLKVFKDNKSFATKKIIKR